MKEMLKTEEKLTVSNSTWRSELCSTNEENDVVLDTTRFLLSFSNVMLYWNLSSIMKNFWRVIVDYP
jgi:hypothetical protein